MLKIRVPTNGSEFSVSFLFLCNTWSCFPHCVSDTATGHSPWWGYRPVCNEAFPAFPRSTRDFKSCLRCAFTATVCGNDRAAMKVLSSFLVLTAWLLPAIVCGSAYEDGWAAGLISVDATPEEEIWPEAIDAEGEAGIGLRADCWTRVAWLANGLNGFYRILNGIRLFKLITE